MRNKLTVNPGVGANPEVANISDRVADLETRQQSERPGRTAIGTAWAR